MTAMQSVKGKIGVGIVGTGGIANAHAMSIKGNPDTEIVGFAEIRPGVAEAFGQRHGVDVPIFDDFRELVKMDGLDAIVVATSNDAHAPASIAAAEAGKHALCEKPMTTKLEDAAAMVAATEKADTCGMIGYSKRFFRGTRYLYDLIRRENLGRLYAVRAFYLQGWLSNPNAPTAWRLEREKTGTGVLGDLAAHVLDLALHLTGDEIKRVTGMLKTYVPERPTPDNPGQKQVVDVDDGCMFGAELKSGAMGVFEASRNATGRPDHWRIEIDFEKGAFIYDNVEGIVRLSSAEGIARRAGWMELPIPARYGAEGRSFQDEFNHFIQCIQTGQKPVPDFADGQRIDRILDAVVRSSETGTAIDV